MVGELRRKLALPRVRLTGDTWDTIVAGYWNRVGLMTLLGRFEAPWLWPMRVQGCAGSGQVLRPAALAWSVQPRRVPSRSSQIASSERYGVS